MFSEAISSIPSCWRRSSSADGGGDLGIGVGQRGGEEALEAGARDVDRSWCVVSADGVNLAMRRAWRPPSNSVARKILQAILGHLLADDARAERQHVGVVMLARVSRAVVHVMAQRGADGGVAVGGDRMPMPVPQMSTP